MNLGNSPAELEVRRIARLLRTEAHHLADLVGVGVEDLRELRDQITRTLFDAHVESWERAVAVSGIVPTGIAARLAERALGPVLTARVTRVTPPARAVDIARKLAPEFLADVAMNLDPRTASDTVAAMPPTSIAAVSEVLAHREEWLVMADFVAVLPPDALATTVEALDERAILEMAVLIERPERTGEIIALLDDDRVAALRAAAATHGLAAHLEHIRGAVAEPQRARLVAL